MQRLAQEYYFYLGASYLGNYRNEKKALFKKSNPQHLAEAIQSLSKAEMLADSYLLNTGDREKYYLGLAYAMKQEARLAQEELVKVNQESDYFPKAQVLMTDLQ
jgi:hypothetical protein